MATTSSFPHVNKMIEQLSVVPENQIGLPNWRLTASGGTTTTITVDTSGSGAGRDDENLESAPADFLNGMQVYWKTGANSPSVFTIEDFSSVVGTGTITVPTMDNAPTPGDELYIINTLGFSNVSLAGTVDQVEREFITRTLDKAPVLKTNKRWTGTFDAEIFGLTTALDSTATAAIDRTAQLLSLFGQSRSYVGAVVDAGSTTTTVNVVSSATLTAGDLVMINGEIREISNVVGGGMPSFDVDVALSTIPAALDNVYGGEVWTPDDTGHRTATLCHLIDDQLFEYQGTYLSVKASSEWGSMLKWSLTASGDNWLLEDAFGFEATEPSEAPIEMLVGDSYFNGSALCINSFEFDEAAEIQEIKDTCSGLQFAIRGRSPNMKVVWRDVDAVPKNTWEQYDELKPLRLSFGNVAGRSIAFSGEAQPGDVAGSDVNSTMYWDSTFLLRDDFTSLTHTPPKITRF